MTTRQIAGDYIFILIVVALGSAVCFRYIHKPDFNQLAIQAIVGEAANQGLDTMVCIAHAIRNRGNLNGVYGTWAAHNKTESPETWKEAVAAWDLSGEEKWDPVNGAKNFGTEADLIREGIDNDDHTKIQCGDFYFY